MLPASNTRPNTNNGRTIAIVMPTTKRDLAKTLFRSPSRNLICLVKRETPDRREGFSRKQQSPHHSEIFSYYKSSTPGISRGIFLFPALTSSGTFNVTSLESGQLPNKNPKLRASVPLVGPVPRNAQAGSLCSCSFRTFWRFPLRSLPLGTFNATSSQSGQQLPKIQNINVSGPPNRIP